MREVQSLNDARVVIKQLMDRLDRLEDNSIDFHQRRITNAHPSIDQFDYVVRKELLEATESISTVTKAINAGVNFTELGGVGFDLDSPLAAGIINQSRPIAIDGGVLNFCKACSNDPPSGGSLIIDIERSTNNGSTWNSIFLSGNPNKINIPANSFNVITTTTFSISQIAKNTLFRVNIIQVGPSNPGGFVSIDVVWSKN